MFDKRLMAVSTEYKCVSARNKETKRLTIVFCRVLRDYFNYDVFFVENITDIDDKIIRRARQNHLFERYVADDPDLNRVIADCNEVSLAFGETVKKTTDPDKKAMQV